ncbi:MAG TPA: type II toxin-antitoxin system antitoxin SocA domain-containing protein [Kofleriaceae bacterium]
MTSVFDIAAEIRSQTASNGNDWWRLNKLVYYVQAWSLVWRSEPAFSEAIQAWKDGPVVSPLYADLKHHDHVKLDRAAPVSSSLQSHVAHVIDAYKHLTTKQLIDLTHQEPPWKKTRGDLPPDANSDRVIPLDMIRRYYSWAWRTAERDRVEAGAKPVFVGSVADFQRLVPAT